MSPTRITGGMRLKQRIRDLLRLRVSLRFAALMLGVLILSAVAILRARPVETAAEGRRNLSNRPCQATGFHIAIAPLHAPPALHRFHAVSAATLRFLTVTAMASPASHTHISWRLLRGRKSHSAFSRNQLKRTFT